MKYLLLIYGNDEIWGSLPPDGFAEVVSAVDAYNTALRASGELIDAKGLETRALSVRVQNGETVVTDGPYLEAKEFVGSYLAVDVASEERAVEIARGHPGLRLGGGIEVWPLMRPDALAD